MEKMTAEVTCHQCKTKFDGEIPKAEIANLITLSLVSWAHPTSQKCPNCGQPYQMIIGSIQGYKIGWVPLQPEEESKIEVVGSLPFNPRGD